MRVTLAVPDLLRTDRAALERIAVLARLARYAPPPDRHRDGVDAALAAAAGLAPDTPLAPLAAAGAGLDPGERYVLRADPVALVAGRDDVLLAGRVTDLTDAEAAALAATLDAHFAADGVAFHAPRADAWFATVHGAERPDTTPLPAVRGAIHARLPRGAHGGTWRRWMSEIQMLLHAHPVNAAREARGRAPVTALWISGGGSWRDVGPLAPIAVYATPAFGGDVARGIARAAGHAPQRVPARYAEIASTEAALVVLPDNVDVAALATAWLEPAVAALERGALARLALVGGGDGAAWTWSAPPPNAARRWSARLAPRGFAFPTEEASA